MKIPELDPRSKKILKAGAALALGAAAFRSTKTEGPHLTYDFSVWIGENTKRVFGDVIDDTKKAFGRITGELILGPSNEVLDVQNIELTDKGADPEARLGALEKAVQDKNGWSGQSKESN